MTAGERRARETGERPAGETPADFELIPAVDVLGDEAVRLEQGDFARVTLRAGDPAELVRRFAEARPPRIPAGALALGAAGADRVVVGSAAFAGPDAVRAYVETLGERLVVAVDVRGGVVAATGWESSTGLGC